MIARRRVFGAVFPSSSDKPASTPQATPLIGTGAFEPYHGGSSQDFASDTIWIERSWQYVTEYLAIPQRPVTIDDARQNQDAEYLEPAKLPSQAVIQAFEHLLEANTSQATPRQDLYAWYLQEISRHYLTRQSPLIAEYLRKNDPTESILLTLKHTIQHVYLGPLEELQRTRLPSLTPITDQLRKRILALVSTSLSKSNFSALFGGEILRLARSFFGLSNSTPKHDMDQMQTDDDVEQMFAEQRLQTLLLLADMIGLGGSLTEKTLAEAMGKVLSEFVETHYSNRWTSPSNVPQELADWIEKTFTPVIARSLACLQSSRGLQEYGRFKSSHDVDIWRTRAINELGLLRLRHLFNLVVNWDESRGAIEDLKQYLTTTNARAHVTNHFSSELTRRLLQPGASTSQILDLYIRLIQAFVVLDPRGVLLDRVARPIRRYLREREDTVKLIVGGLLANPYDEENTDPLAILAVRLEEATHLGNEEDESGLDWDDMNWMPDPIDAEPEYKKSKSSDIIGHLISLFETRDVFVKEFQNILGERLLNVKNDFEAETRLLELLKIRFGEAPLQSCEVMLRDVFDSARTDKWVRREQGMDSSMDISAKVLSRLFWPALHTESFKLPPEIEKLQNAYAAAFQKHKTSRKLTWLDVLGDVTVELELEDRKITETVKTPQAALIYAFAGDSSRPISKTAEQLVEELEMDEDLVENCLLFWVGKLVLVKSEDNSYTVLERLPRAAQEEASLEQASKSSTLAAAAMASATAAAAPVSALKSEADITDEKMQVYWQFIVGMLTNQGAMPLARIVMMLKLAMAGGFPYSNEELRVFMGKKVDDGKLELAAGSYKLVKPQASLANAQTSSID